MVKFTIALKGAPVQEFEVESAKIVSGMRAAQIIMAYPTDKTVGGFSRKIEVSQSFVNLWRSIGPDSAVVTQARVATDTIAGSSYSVVDGDAAFVRIVSG